MTVSESSGVRRVSTNLPKEYIEGLDQLKKEWGLRSRGAVLERLLEDIFTDYSDSLEILEVDNNSELKDINKENDLDNQYNEDRALVLIGRSEIDSNDIPIISDEPTPIQKQSPPSTGIDLPGFVRSKTSNLRKTLSNKDAYSIPDDSYINTVKDSEVDVALRATKEHWFSLYGNKPGDNVIEAAMIWIARDIWPRIEGSEDKPFTWTAATKLMSQYCPSWDKPSISLETIIVVAGVLEDPFSSSNLKSRIPTLIRRFVNQYKRRQNINSYQTIESTMTVHGALKLLGMPTQAGSALTLKSIKESYKNKAMLNHPDAGGSTEAMRKLNEGYQLLKDLYKNK